MGAGGGDEHLAGRFGGQEPAGGERRLGLRPHTAALTDPDALRVARQVLAAEMEGGEELHRLGAD